MNIVQRYKELSTLPDVDRDLIFSKKMADEFAKVLAENFGPEDVSSMTMQAMKSLMATTSFMRGFGLGNVLDNIQEV